MNLYEIDRDTQIDEFGVDHSNFSLRDEIEYNFRRAEEKRQQKSLMSQAVDTNYQQSPWYRKTYDKVYAEANKLGNTKFNDKYKHSVVSCIGAQDGLYGALVTGAMGIGKELQDISKKFPRQWSGKQNYGGYGAILRDSALDIAADATGLYTGYLNPYENCYDIMKKYYNPYPDHEEQY